jgi:hypothetical protein
MPRRPGQSLEDGTARRGHRDRLTTGGAGQVNNVAETERALGMSFEAVHPARAGPGRKQEATYRTQQATYRTITYIKRAGRKGPKLHFFGSRKVYASQIYFISGTEPPGTPPQCKYGTSVFKFGRYTCEPKKCDLGNAIWAFHVPCAWHVAPFSS